MRPFEFTTPTSKTQVSALLGKSWGETEVLAGGTDLLSLMKDEISIGRGEDNDVVIPHASVSRQHARLMRRDGGFELMDLNSTNGSYVEDRQIHGSAFLSSGSHVRLGDIRFVLQL